MTHLPSAIMVLFVSVGAHCAINDHPVLAYIFTVSGFIAAWEIYKWQTKQIAQVEM